MGPPQEPEKQNGENQFYWKEENYIFFDKTVKELRLRWEGIRNGINLQVHNVKFKKKPVEKGRWGEGGGGDWDGVGQGEEIERVGDHFLDFRS